MRARTVSVVVCLARSAPGAGPGVPRQAAWMDLHSQPRGQPSRQEGEAGNNAVLALEVIRRMRGASQPYLLRCADEASYVVKFRNNPQHVRVLANEMLAARLAMLIGLPVADPAFVEVPAGNLARPACSLVRVILARPAGLWWWIFCRIVCSAK